MKCQFFSIALASLPFASMVAQEQKPNIIFIIDDQQRGDAMGCMGNDKILTPNMDALAEDGFLFNNAYSSTPSSTPARACLLTGKSPWHHGMLGYGRVAEHYENELPQMLSDCGYLAIGVGKMHWYPQTATHGYRTTIIDESGRVESPYFKSDYRKWFETMAPGVNPDETGIGWNEHAANVYQLPENLHPTVWTADVAIRTISNHDGKKPLFLKVSFARPHSPYDPPQRVLDMYKDIEMDGPFKGEWSKHVGEELTNPELKPSAAYGQFGDEYVKHSKKHYYASITYVDEQIGRIVKVLKEKGMYDNTIICFCADHGDMMGDHNHWRKTYAYEGSAGIPMIVKVPKRMQGERPAGSVIENVVELRDFYPTLLEAAGGKVPADVDGLSLLPLIQKKNTPWREFVDLEHATAYSEDNYWVALTNGKLKYIYFYRTGKEQLFDLVKDPTESVELSASKKYQKTLKKLRAAMVDHLSERGEGYVKDGQLVVRNKVLLYSPNFPKASTSKKERK